jgi:hypothetical protein
MDLNKCPVCDAVVTTIEPAKNFVCLGRDCALSGMVFTPFEWISLRKMGIGKPHEEASQ